MRETRRSGGERAGTGGTGGGGTKARRRGHWSLVSAGARVAAVGCSSGWRKEKDGWWALETVRRVRGWEARGAARVSGRGWSWQAHQSWLPRGHAHPAPASLTVAALSALCPHSPLCCPPCFPAPTEDEALDDDRGRRLYGRPHMDEVGGGQCLGGAWACSQRACCTAMRGVIGGHAALAPLLHANRVAS